jgi:hypothetical protein
MRAWGSIPFRVIPTCSARAPISNKVSSSRTRTPVEPNEDACKTIERVGINTTAELREVDCPISSRRLDDLSVLLTVKLRGRALAPNQSRGCTLSSRTRGDTTEHHGPLQRLLGGSPLIRNEPMLLPTGELLLEPWQATLPQKPNLVPSLRLIKGAHAAAAAEAGEHTANAVERNVNREGDVYDAFHRLPPNGEVEGPRDHAGQATRAHTVPRRPRRQTRSVSRTPPTIVRGHGDARERMTCLQDALRLRTALARRDQS